MALKEMCHLPDSDVAEFLDSFDTVLTDCDGVLWRGNEVLEGASETVRALRRHGKKIIYVTNNSLKTRRQYVEKCRDLNFGGSVEDIFTTSNLCARYLKKQNFRKTVYLFGGKGIAAELDEVCIRHIGSDAEIPSAGPLTDLDEVIAFVEARKKDVGCVIVSHNAFITYRKMMTAVSFLEDPEVLFLGTNRDAKFPSGSGISVPGTGAFIASIEVASGRTATILGKPEKFMFEAIQEEHHIDPKRTIMIGDRCDTDILFGKYNGLRTVMVGTGINTLEEVLRWKQSGNEKFAGLIADYYLGSLGLLLPHVERRLENLT